jgi:GTP-binding protein
MHFIDEATITVRSGDGGRGCVSFRREKFVPRGGPDGGNGGNGGSVLLEVSPSLSTLLDFRYRNLFKAARGQHGMGKNMHGKGAPDRRISVPPGTIVTDADTGEILADLTRPGETLRAAKGGRGGRRKR